jgi:8-oxo-dGTP pyrophosphatase MutT (NUDIX family)
MTVPEDVSKEKLAQCLKESKWSWRDVGILVSSCLGGSALGKVWGILEPLLGVNAVTPVQMGTHAPLIFAATVILVAVGHRLVIKSRARHQIALYAESAAATPRPEPLLALRFPDAVLESLRCALEKISQHSNESVAVSDLLGEQTRTQEIAAVLAMLRGLGLISVTQIGVTLAVRAVSDVAADFLLSMALHLEERAPFVGIFGEAERNMNERFRVREIIRKTEQNRVALAKVSGRVARAARRAESALVVIKANFDGEDCVLMQWSESWGRRDGDGRASGDPGYYWFIGGVMESQDEGSFARCATREICEELGVGVGDVQLFAQVLFQRSDVRVSRRVGLYTEYVYHVFAATLRPSPETAKVVQLEWVREMSVHTRGHGPGMIPRQMRWRKWSEIRQDMLLREDAGVIVDELEKHLQAVPLQPGM